MLIPLGYTVVICITIRRPCGAVVFGEIVEGMDVIKKIEGVRTDRMDNPLEPVKIADCGEL